MQYCQNQNQAKTVNQEIGQQFWQQLINEVNY